MHLKAQEKKVELLQNKPNPADEATLITVKVNAEMAYKSAWISIKDLTGKEITKMPIVLKEGINEVEYRHGYHTSGTFIYTLYLDGKALQSLKMVFTN